MKNILLCLFLVFGAFADDLCFVQLTDTHFGTPEHLERTRKAVEAINSLPFDVQFVAITGDLMADNITNKAAVADGLSVLNQLTVLVHFVAGNHDVKTNNLHNTLAAFVNRFGSLASRHTYGGVECIFAYTEPLARGFEVEGYDPLAATETLLKECGDRPVLVFHHAASLTDFYNNKVHSGWTNAAVRGQWQAMLQRYGVDAVIAGHFHRGELHWIRDIPVYVSPPIAGYWGRQGSFRIYHYENGRLSYQTQYID